METKKCIKCGKVKNVSEFYDSGKNDGKLKNECKDCVRKRVRENNRKKRGVKLRAELIPKRTGTSCYECRRLGRSCEVNPKVLSTNLSHFCNNYKL